MLEKLKKLKKAIQNIKNGIDIEENRAILMLEYIDAEINIESIKLLAQAVNTNINIFELSFAYSWFLMGYNYIDERELNEEDYDDLMLVAAAINEEEITKDNQFDIFRIWYLDLIG